jgi:hypothetical protein
MGYFLAIEAGCCWGVLLFSFFCWVEVEGEWTYLCLVFCSTTTSTSFSFPSYLVVLSCGYLDPKMRFCPGRGSSAGQVSRSMLSPVGDGNNKRNGNHG